MNLKTKIKSPAGIAGFIGLALLTMALAVYGGFLIGSAEVGASQTTKNKSAVTHADGTWAASQENSEAKNTPSAASKSCNPFEANPCGAAEDYDHLSFLSEEVRKK